MAGTSAFKVAADLRKEGFGTRFVFLSAYLTDSNVQEILALGGSGYLLKSAGVGEIAAAIRTVAAGGSHFGAEVRERVSEERPGARALRPRSRLALLTTREKEVLRCVANDLSGKEIATLLSLSVRTVDRHKSNIMEKLAIHSQVGLTRFAFAEGLCDARAPGSLPAAGPARGGRE
jgi:two-component system response regulator NreC